MNTPTLFNGTALNPGSDQPEGFSGTALNGKRKRAPRTPRPIDPRINAAIEEALNKFGGSWMRANPVVLGIIPQEVAAEYGFDLESYEPLNLSHNYKIKSFFTLVKRTNDIILDYALQGLLPLTIRQIHYQMVTRHKDYPNTAVSYNHLSEDIRQSRMCGFVPWNAIDDPTRDLHDFASWRGPQERVACAARTHHLNRWENQTHRPLVLVEKDAVLGIISRVCQDLDVPYLSCKGYGMSRGDVAALLDKPGVADALPPTMCSQYRTLAARNISTNELAAKHHVSEIAMEAIIEGWESDIVAKTCELYQRFKPRSTEERRDGERAENETEAAQDAEVLKSGGDSIGGRIVSRGRSCKTGNRLALDTFERGGHLRETDHSPDKDRGGSQISEEDNYGENSGDEIFRSE